MTFDVGTDIDIDNVLVNNRYSQAQPFLPQDVKNFGVTIKKSLAFPLMVISLYSPDGRYDPAFLAQLRAHQRQRRAPPREGRRRHPQPRRVRLLDAHLAQARRAARGSASRCTDVQNAVRAAERREPGRAGRAPSRRRRGSSSRTRCARRGVSSTPEEFGDVVVRENPDGSARARQRRRAHRARVAELPAVRHASTASRRRSSPPSRRRGRTRSTSPRASARRWRTSPKRFPPGIEYKVSLDTTRAGEGRHPRDRRDAARGHRPRRPRRLRLPPELASDAHPAPHGAGVARRRVRGVPAPRLLGQHAVALRARARDRPRRRRRHRRRRGGRAPHRGGHGAARRDAQGDVARCRGRSSRSRSSSRPCSSRSPS